MIARPSDPPLTNRGVKPTQNPSHAAPEPIRGDSSETPIETQTPARIDYLKVTVWGPVEAAVNVVERGLIDRFGTVEVGSREESVEPASGRIDRIERRGPVEVLGFRGTNEYCQVEIKGAGCTIYGSEGLGVLLADVAATFGRWRATRIDLTTPSAPELSMSAIEDALRSLSFRSRLLGNTIGRTGFPDGVDRRENGLGTTYYIGWWPKSLASGQGVKRRGDRELVIYDARGPVRVEGRWYGEAAEAACALVASKPVEEWDGLIRSMHRGLIDFGERRGSNESRWRLFPWWEEYTRGVGRVVARFNPERPEPTAIGKVDGILQRHSMALEAAVRAFGPAWIIDRIRRHAGQRWTPEDDRMVRYLERWKGSGIAGVPAAEDGDEIPI